jgi:hypothetical protein
MSWSLIEGDLPNVQKIHTSRVNSRLDGPEGLFHESWRRRLSVSLWMTEFIMLMIFDWHRLNLYLGDLHFVKLDRFIENCMAMYDHAVCSNMKHFMNLVDLNSHYGKFVKLHQGRQKISLNNSERVHIFWMHCLWFFITYRLWCSFIADTKPCYKANDTA